jgi:predicted acyl esterase
MQTWSSLNDSLDRNELASFARQHMGTLAGMATPVLYPCPVRTRTGPDRYRVQGVAPVDEDVTGAMLREAVKAHESNYDIYETSLQAEFRGDKTASGLMPEHFSPHAFMSEIEASGAAIYSWSSWYDGAYTFSAIKRFLSVKTSGSRLILGPWDHGGRQNPDPFVRDGKSHFDHTGEAHCPALVGHDQDTVGQPLPFGKDKRYRAAVL